jgi:hypothetical protein
MADIYDGRWRLFSHDALTGRSVWVIHEGDRTHWRTDYPVENLIKDNAAHHADSMGNRFGEISRVASIPINVFYDKGLAQAHREGDRQQIKRFLNDSDNAAWRTRGGRV